jgi:RNA polymerase sigma-70 factor, ECF subfamily
MANNEKKLVEEIEAMYGELRRIAAAQLRRERSDHTLSATALVNEAYLKLSSSHLEWNDKNHFLGIAARAMRQILVNHALTYRAEKRGGDWIKLTLTSATPEIEQKSLVAEEALDVVMLNDALNELEEVDPRQVKIVELRYFAGLSIQETADVMSLSTATIKREWTLARIYLKHALS